MNEAVNSAIWNSLDNGHLNHSAPIGRMQYVYLVAPTIALEYPRQSRNLLYPEWLSLVAIPNSYYK